MTDKQIIIDGVDVSGCKYVNIADPCKNTCQYFCTPCEWVEIQNCMYKYAKRKEQECEELKEELKTKTYHWEQCTEEILKGTKQFVDRMEKAEKTLTEIKEIAEKHQATAHCCYLEDMTEILQKISECEVGNEET